MYFGYRKFDSVTSVLMATGLPSFETVLHNAKYVFNRRMYFCTNAVLSKLRAIDSFY